jgi:hypothetical protein
MHPLLASLSAFAFRSSKHPKPHPTYPKFPAIDHSYESVHTPGIFFSGAATHSLDFKRSAGGFIHGYRYTSELSPWLHELVINDFYYLSDSN